MRNGVKRLFALCAISMLLAAATSARAASTEADYKAAFAAAEAANNRPASCATNGPRR